MVEAIVQLFQFLLGRTQFVQHSVFSYHRSCFGGGFLEPEFRCGKKVSRFRLQVAGSHAAIVGIDLDPDAVPPVP